MAFIDCTIYNEPVSASAMYRDDGTAIIRAKCGAGYIAMDCEEAVKLRDDLSRAITEAATAAAKSAQPAGEAA